MGSRLKLLTGYPTNRTHFMHIREQVLTQYTSKIFPGSLYFQLILRQMITEIHCGPENIYNIPGALDPKLIGLPPISGEQTVSISVLGVHDSVSFQAPQYRGGPMSVYFNEDLVDSASADSILAHYNIEIMRADYPSFKLEVNGYPIDSLSQAWQDNNYILEAYFSQRDMIESIDVIRTNTEQIDSRQVFRLDQNYPNPFNPSTNIPLSLDRPGQTNISVYKITGEFVYEIYDGWLGTGQHYFSFTASDLASGTYMYKVRVGDQEMVKTMTLIK